MTASTFEAGSFGMRPSTDGQSAGYGILGHSTGFPAPAVEALAQLGRSFSWGSAAEERLSSCYALGAVPGHTGLLLARLLDVGRDDHQRPHTLRIDAVWLSPILCSSTSAASSGE